MSLLGTVTFGILICREMADIRSQCVRCKKYHMGGSYTARLLSVRSKSVNQGNSVVERRIYDIGSRDINRGSC